MAKMKLTKNRIRVIQVASVMAIVAAAYKHGQNVKLAIEEAKKLSVKDWKRHYLGE